MRKLLLLLALLLAGSCVSVASAEAHENYKPWKAAMVVWFDDWSTHRWRALPIDWTQYDNRCVSVETPYGFNYLRNNWGEKARLFAQFITAVEGPMPNGQLDRPLKAILTPFLGVDPEVWPPPRMTRQVAP
jgi:uncharacterized protein YceK